VDAELNILFFCPVYVVPDGVVVVGEGITVKLIGALTNPRNAEVILR